IERQNYVSLKAYFEEKKRRLKLDAPLIFYDDEAMRIDLGYGPREFNMYFKDLDRLVKSKGIIRFDHSSMSLAGNKIVNMNDEYSDFLDNEKEQLIKMADEVGERVLPSKVKTTLDEGVTNEKIFLRKMMEQNRGVVIGEKHSERSAKEFLVNNMAYLKELGVTQIYMEHLLSERFQAMLDLPEMPQDLKAYLKYLDKEHDLEDEKGSFSQIVQVAKENGIRVIAIDSEAIYRIGAYSGEIGR
ncbi:MAG TPA: hypothetical protein VGV92_04835, partial [Gammaproteobacteria bacterium]|nr:hypothetical protein [Gammaproteobacteria bacterium]